MSTSLSFVIRDGISNDIAACLGLDHDYETEYVWQMRLTEDVGFRQITFQTEKLPRILETSWPTSEQRLRLALPDDQCFLVAQSREDDREILGYLAMRLDPVYRIAQLHDLIVSRPYRRHRIGTRLFTVARKWAQEHDLMRVTTEVQTRNYPAILFCQQVGLAFCGFNDHYFPDQDIAVFFSRSLR